MFWVQSLIYGSGPKVFWVQSLVYGSGPKIFWDPFALGKEVAHMKYGCGVIFRVLFDSHELTHETITVLPEVGKRVVSPFCLLGFPMLMFEAFRHGYGVSNDNETYAFVFSNQMEYFMNTNCGSILNFEK